MQRIGSAMSLNDLPPGTRVGDDYTIIEPLARGGMGVVYVALQESTNKRRALKVMTPQPGDPEALRRRFEQEARVSAQIESDHVVQIIGAGVDRDTNLPWLAMELLDGETLDARLERGPLGWMEAWRVIGELCHGLEAAHRLGVVHRDLKPCNVFLARSWRTGGSERVVKILDFGIAKRVGDAGQTVGLLGTPLYMAPEQTMPGVALQPSTDVWGLGLLVFTILTGSSYWRSAGDSNTQIGAMLREIVLDPLPAATERARELGVLERLPNGFDLWFARCVVRDPAARFADAGAAYRALEPLFADATRRAEDGYPAIPAAPTMPAFPVVATGAFPAVTPPTTSAAAPVARGVMRPVPVDTSGREKESLAPLAYEPSYVEDSRWSEPPSIPKNHIAAKVFGVLLVGSAAAAFAAFTIMRQPDGFSLRPPDERGEAVQAAAVPPVAAPVEPAAPAPTEAAAAPVVTAAPVASAPPSAAPSAEPSAAPTAESKAKAAPKAPPRTRAARRAAPPAPPPSPAPTDVPDTSSDFPYVSGPPGSEPAPAPPPDAPPSDEPYPSDTAPAPEPEPPPADPTPGKFDPGTI